MDFRCHHWVHSLLLRNVTTIVVSTSLDPLETYINFLVGRLKGRSNFYPTLSFFPQFLLRVLKYKLVTFLPTSTVDNTASYDVQIRSSSHEFKSHRESVHPLPQPVYVVLFSPDRTSIYKPSVVVYLSYRFTLNFDTLIYFRSVLPHMSTVSSPGT